MKMSFRTISLAALAAIGLLATVAPSQAQSVPANIVVHLSPTHLRYAPGTVPSQCLAYALPGQGPVVFCEGLPITPADVNVALMYGGVKPWGWKTPDDCILRHGMISGTGFLYCKTRHW